MTLSAAPPTTNRPTFRDTAEGLWSLVRGVRQHWPIVVASTLLLAGSALIYSKSTTKIYEAVTLLEIEPNPVQPLGDKTSDVLNMGAGNYWDTQEYYATQYKIIVSDRVLGKVARDLGLWHDDDFLGHRDPTDPQPTAATATALLRRRVIVDPIKGSRLVNVRVDDWDAKRGQRICDAIAAAYIEQNLDTAVNASGDAVVWLNSQVDTVKGELEHDEDALHEFKKQNDLPSTSINEASNMLRVEMQELDTSLVHARAKKEEIAAREAELSKVSTDSPDNLPASELLASPYLQSLRKEYQDSAEQHAGLIASGKGEEHPLVKSAAERESRAKAALLAEVKNIQGAVERDLAVVTREEAGLSGLYNSARKRAVDLNMKEIEYHRLDRAREQDEKLYGMLNERLKDSDLARMMKVNNVRVVDAAIEPTRPIRPNTPVNVTLGSLIGLALGLVLARVRQQLDSSVKTPGDVEQLLGATFLGLLPSMDERDKGARSRRAGGFNAGDRSELIVHDQPLSGTAEAARSIRTNLMLMNPDRPYRAILVTSAAPAEGKTTVACNMAIALAQGGQRVCIVDCDLRRPKLHRVFGRVGDGGVTNVLVGDVTIEEVAKPTQVDNLWSIPAGPLPPNPADILQSERFKKLIRELCARFDRVVIDSPPTVAVTDAAIASNLVDGTIFVVRGGKTSKHLAAQGLRSLLDVGANVIGVVLNAVNLNSNEYGHYYHYYYYKRGGYESTADTSESESERPNAPPLS